MAFHPRHHGALPASKKKKFSVYDTRRTTTLLCPIYPDRRGSIRHHALFEGDETLRSQWTWPVTTWLWSESMDGDFFSSEWESLCDLIHCVQPVRCWVLAVPWSLPSVTGFLVETSAPHLNLNRNWMKTVIQVVRWREAYSNLSSEWIKISHLFQKAQHVWCRWQVPYDGPGVWREATNMGCAKIIATHLSQAPHAAPILWTCSISVDLPLVWDSEEMKDAWLLTK